MLTIEQSEKIKTELLKKVPNLICPMCKNNKFTLADGYFSVTLQSDLSSIQLGGLAIPTIGIICDHCGFVSQHAIGRLGLLPQTEKTELNEPK